MRKAKNRDPIRGPNGFRYRQQYGVVVLCDSERHQQRVYNVLTRRGHRCRVVTV